MLFQKCRNCKHRCRCCASHFFDRGPYCSRCENHYDEFYPAEHVIYCPLDGLRIKHNALYDINGRLVEVEWDPIERIYKRRTT